MASWNKYPPEVHEFVKKWCSELRDQELAEACNRELGTHFTTTGMKSFRNNHGYLNGMKRGLSKEEYMARNYPPGMYEFIRDNSWGVGSAKMADMVNEKFGMNWTPTGMKQFRARNRIKSGETGWFQKGRSPGNKGKTWEEVVGEKRAAEIREKCARTQFKKGDRPLNELPVGSIVINTNGYKMRKKSMTGGQWERWEFLHRAVWEEHHGPIPEGMMVSFRDNDRGNCDIENLMLVTKAENSALTGLGYRFEDPDLTDAGLAVIRLKNAAREAKRKRKDK